jgi:NAD(P)-dependent dehydrogenase (short-subunit alcohol dehydrogenase family)
MPRALVTGASRGIGRALVEALAARGYEVVATARDPETLADLPAVLRLPLDVTSDASVAAVAETAGRIDVLVNNAAVSIAAAVEDTPAAAALDMFDTNVIGPLRLISAFAPGMRAAGGGTVVNVSSVAGRAVFPLNGVHAASKHALEALSEGLAIEAGRFGLRVLVIELGSVDTGMFANQAQFSSGAYAELERAQQGQLERAKDRPRFAQSPAEAASDIADQIADADAPLRVPIGKGAAHIVAERARTADADWLRRFNP